MDDHVVLDTNVLYAALQSRRGASRRVVDLVLDEDLTAHVSVPLVLEYEEVLLREAEVLGVTAHEARIVIAALVCTWCSGPTGIRSTFGGLNTFGTLMTRTCWTRPLRGRARTWSRSTKATFIGLRR